MYYSLERTLTNFQKKKKTFFFFPIITSNYKKKEEDSCLSCSICTYVVFFIGTVGLLTRTSETTVEKIDEQLKCVKEVR
jgi:hypothetical protein